MTTQRDTLIRLVAFLAILLLGFILAPASSTEPAWQGATPGPGWESRQIPPGPPMDRPGITRDESAVGLGILIVAVDLAIARRLKARGR